MHTLWYDLRFGWRMLAKNLGFTFLAILLHPSAARNERGSDDFASM